MLKKNKLSIVCALGLVFGSISLWAKAGQSNNGPANFWDDVDFDDGWSNFSEAPKKIKKSYEPTMVAEVHGEMDPFEMFPEFPADAEVRQPVKQDNKQQSLKPNALNKASASEDPFAAFDQPIEDVKAGNTDKKEMKMSAGKNDSTASSEMSSEYEFTAEDNVWEGGFAPEKNVVGIKKNSEGPDTLSIDFSDEEIRNIVRSVADVYNLNIIIPDSLMGVISVKLHEVTWQQVLDAVLEPVGFAYLEENGIIKIKSREMLLTEPVENRIYALRFASASGVRGTVAGLVNPEIGGKVVADARTNVLIVTERPSRLKDIELVVKRLDAEEAQIMIETKVVEKKESDTDNIGFNWSSLSGYSVRGFAGKSLSDSSGVNDGGYLSSTGSGTNDTKTHAAVLSANTFDAVLSALTSDTNNKLIASPNVVTMNNTPANIKIQDRQPVPNYEFNEQNGKLSISGFEFIDIGINVNVTPQAKEELITLDIEPEFSTSSASVTIGGADSGSLSANVPVISERRSKSIVTLKSGYTVALGGMMKEERAVTFSRVPGLGHLPVLGKYLFTHENNESTVTNLILFVTATQIGFNGEVKFQSKGEGVLNANPRLMNELGITTKDIPGYPIANQEQQLLDELRMLREDISAKKRKDRLEDEVEAVHAIRKTAEKELQRNSKRKDHREKLQRQQKV